ncbi:MAG: hypothetical protein VYB87_03520 [Acidobacteriota bacterium]|nr:hypothetical protein [Acidobacteriota bacterium]
MNIQSDYWGRTKHIVYKCAVLTHTENKSRHHQSADRVDLRIARSGLHREIQACSAPLVSTEVGREPLRTSAWTQNV